MMFSIEVKEKGKGGHFGAIQMYPLPPAVQSKLKLFFKSFKSDMNFVLMLGLGCIMNF